MLSRWELDSKHKVSKSTAKLSDRELCDIVKQKSGVRDACIISPSDVQTAAWVRLKCQFGCDCYGQCLVCPPFTPTPQQMRQVLDAYSRAVLIHFEPDADVKAIVAELERTIFFARCLEGFRSWCRSLLFLQALCRRRKAVSASGAGPSINGGLRNRRLFYRSQSRFSDRGGPNNTPVP